MSSVDIPFSRLTARGRVGADFFQRIDAVDDRVAVGLCEDLRTYARADLDIESVDPRIREFYEHTDRFELLVRPAWRWFFRPAALLWRAFSRAVGQMEMPIEDERLEDRITSRIVALRAAVDGRESPRAWVRTFADGRPMYVAAYSTHRRNGAVYMNIAFPLPCCNLTSILRMDAMADGIVLSTRGPGDNGVYWVTPRFHLRTPLQETIRVWAVGASGCPFPLRQGPPGTTVVARHDMWLCGVRYLTLDYFIYPR